MLRACFLCYNLPSPDTHTHRSQRVYARRPRRSREARARGPWRETQTAQTSQRVRERGRRGVLTSGRVVLVASYAACSILRVLTQWGATLVII